MPPAITLGLRDPEVAVQYGEESTPADEVERRRPRMELAAGMMGSALDLLRDVGTALHVA